MHCIIITQFTFHRLQELKIVTQLGSSFGIVHKGEWNQSDDATTPVAVKVFKEDFVHHQAGYMMIY